MSTANSNMENAIQRSEAERSKWYTNPGGMPQLLHPAEWTLYKHQERLFDTEKEAIDAARKNALAEEERWRNNINELDQRYDAIEDESMKADQEFQEFFDRR